MYIGVDLGTSAVKLLLMDGNGDIVRTVSKEYPLYFPKPGWSEQNPEDWYQKTVEGLQELLDGQTAQRIEGIGIGGQMHGLVVLDKEDQVIRPAILWNDGRSVEECQYLNESIGCEALSKATANIAFTGFTAPKILWMRKHEPKLFSRIAKIMLPKDYLIYRLTGVFTTDPSDASGMLLYDVKHRCWSEKMMGICGITENQLAKVVESYEAVGTVNAEIVQLTGISPKAVVAAGAGDNAAAAIGTGTIADGKCNISLGTSGTIFIASDHFCVDPHNALHAFAHANGHFHLMGCMLSAASCNKWWMEKILKTDEFQKEQENIINLGENQVYFLPYLMGERSPHNDPFARGTFIGMNMDTTREDMTQAVLEGVCFALRDSLEVARSLNIRITEATICGGGAKSGIWKKMLANILNIPLIVLENEEGPALGGALLAAVAAGRFRDVQEAANQVIKVKEKIIPECSLVEKYEKKYQIFKAVYPACKDVYAKICVEDMQ